MRLFILSVTPAKAGVSSFHSIPPEIPAYAGMTVFEMEALCG